jgi:hypothetical protein
MTEDDLIERLWAKRKEDKTMTREEIAGALRPRVVRSLNVFKMYVWLYLAALMATLVIQGVNFQGYRSNITMLTIHMLVAGAALGFAGFGIHIAGAIGRLDRMSDSLADTVRRRLSFFRGKYKAWLWACSASLLLLTWAVTTMIDNMGGTYPINKPIVFFGTLTVMFFGSYAVLRASHIPVVRDLRAVLEDLEAQILQKTKQVDLLQRRWQRWTWVALLIAIVFALLGAWLAVRGVG